MISGLVLALLAGAARADDSADVMRLMRNAQYAEALVRADAFLAKNPRDAQMRFLKGVILTEQNRGADAIAVFTRLTEDYPGLPEPYNNLAVLHAANGQYDKARAALDAAIRTHPAYSVAHENLGDIHARLASQAYDKALQLDTSSTAPRPKLTLMRTLLTPTTGVALAGIPKSVALAAITPPQVKPATVTASVPVPAAAAASPLPPIAAAPAPKPAATTANNPAPAAAVQPVAKPEPAKAEPLPKVEIARAEPPKAVKPVEPPKPATKPEPKPAPSNQERDEALAVVNAWARAWSAQDVKGYLGHYGGEFQPPNGLARKAWEEERRQRIVGKGRINVRIEAPQVVVNGNTATVKFRQIYTSDQLTANTRKTLVLNKQGSRWLIKQEQTGA
jgi:tetratricopeptide (TPR) repeat protein